MELRQRLRSETATAHKNLEARLDILSPDLDAGRYRRILQTFASLHADLEAKLETLASERSNSFAHDYLLHRRKSPLLTKDLGEAPRPSSGNYFGWIQSEAQLLGALYVIEGSTLGGQVVSQHLGKITPTVRTNYFESYGAETGRNWQKFVFVLGNRPASEHDEIVRSADRTFLEIDKAFQFEPS